MTWYAHHLFAPGKPAVLEALAADARLAPFLYHVPGVKDFPWFKPEFAHGLGLHGLAVVRPVAQPDSSAAQWYQEPVLDWAAFGGDPRPCPGLPEGYAEQVPPEGFLRFCEDFSRKLAEPLIFHSCFCWGGDVEFDAAWVFTPARRLYRRHEQQAETVVVQDASGREELLAGDTLRRALAHLDVALPTSFFAPHTRGFPWDKYRLPAKTDAESPPWGESEN